MEIIRERDQEYFKSFKTPEGFKQLLVGLIKAVIRHRPPNIPEFAAQYFEKLGATERQVRGDTEDDVITSECQLYRKEIPKLPPFAVRSIGSPGPIQIDHIQSLASNDLRSSIPRTRNHVGNEPAFKKPDKRAISVCNDVDVTTLSPAEEEFKDEIKIISTWDADQELTGNDESKLSPVASSNEGLGKNQDGQSKEKKVSISSRPTEIQDIRKDHADVTQIVHRVPWKYSTDNGPEPPVKPKRRLCRRKTETDLDKFNIFDTTNEIILPKTAQIVTGNPFAASFASATETSKENESKGEAVEAKAEEEVESEVLPLAILPDETPDATVQENVVEKASSRHSDNEDFTVDELVGREASPIMNREIDEKAHESDEDVDKASQMTDNESGQSGGVHQMRQSTESLYSKPVAYVYAMPSSPKSNSSESSLKKGEDNDSSYPGIEDDKRLISQICDAVRNVEKSSLESQEETLENIEEPLPVLEEKVGDLADDNAPEVVAPASSYARDIEDSAARTIQATYKGYSTRKRLKKERSLSDNLQRERDVPEGNGNDDDHRNEGQESSSPPVESKLDEDGSHDCREEESKEAEPLEAIPQSSALKDCPEGELEHSVPLESTPKSSASKDCCNEELKESEQLESAPDSSASNSYGKDERMESVPLEATQKSSASKAFLEEELMETAPLESTPKPSPSKAFLEEELKETALLESTPKPSPSKTFLEEELKETAPLESTPKPSPSKTFLEEEIMETAPLEPTPKSSPSKSSHEEESKEPASLEATPKSSPSKTSLEGESKEPAPLEATPKPSPSKSSHEEESKEPASLEATPKPSPSKTSHEEESKEAAPLESTPKPSPSKSSHEEESKEPAPLEATPKPSPSKSSHEEESKEAASLEATPKPSPSKTNLEGESKEPAPLEATPKSSPSKTNLEGESKEPAPLEATPKSSPSKSSYEEELKEAASLEATPKPSPSKTSHEEESKEPAPLEATPKSSPSKTNLEGESKEPAPLEATPKSSPSKSSHEEESKEAVPLEATPKSSPSKSFLEEELNETIPLESTPKPSPSKSFLEEELNETIPLESTPMPSPSKSFLEEELKESVPFDSTPKPSPSKTNHEEESKEPVPLEDIPKSGASKAFFEEELKETVPLESTPKSSASNESDRASRFLESLSDLSRRNSDALMTLHGTVDVDEDTFFESVKKLATTETGLEITEGAANEPTKPQSSDALDQKDEEEISGRETRDETGESTNEFHLLQQSHMEAESVEHEEPEVKHGATNASFDDDLRIDEPEEVTNEESDKVTESLFKPTTDEEDHESSGLEKADDEGPLEEFVGKDVDADGVSNSGQLDADEGANAEGKNVEESSVVETDGQDQKDRSSQEEMAIAAEEIPIALEASTAEQKLDIPDLDDEMRKESEDSSNISSNNHETEHLEAESEEPEKDPLEHSSVGETKTEEAGQDGESENQDASEADGLMDKEERADEVLKTSTTVEDIVTSDLGTTLSKDQAATIIQAGVRGHLARKELSKRSTESGMQDEESSEVSETVERGGIGDHGGCEEENVVDNELHCVSGNDDDDSKETNELDESARKFVDAKNESSDKQSAGNELEEKVVDDCKNVEEDDESSIDPDAIEEAASEARVQEGSNKDEEIGNSIGEVGPEDAGAVDDQNLEGTTLDEEEPAERAEDSSANSPVPEGKAEGKLEIEDPDQDENESERERSERIDGELRIDENDYLDAEIEKERAAVVIQAGVRGHLVRASIKRKLPTDKERKIDGESNSGGVAENSENFTNEAHDTAELTEVIEGKDLLKSNEVIGNCVEESNSNGMGVDDQRTNEDMIDSNEIGRKEDIGDDGRENEEDVACSDGQNGSVTDDDGNRNQLGEDDDENSPDDAELKITEERHWSDVSSAPAKNATCFDKGIEWRPDPELAAPTCSAKHSDVVSAHSRVRSAPAKTVLSPIKVKTMNRKPYQFQRPGSAPTYLGGDTEEQAKKKAAVKIQAGFRGYMIRKQIKVKPHQFKRPRFSPEAVNGTNDQSRNGVNSAERTGSYRFNRSAVSSADGDASASGSGIESSAVATNDNDSVISDYARTELDKAATKIQASFRGYKTRSGIKRRYEE